MAEPRIIKKYPNRRLYDTEISRYITVADVRELVVDGVEFKVIDAATSEDLTRNILLQIIVERENGGEPLFTNELLAKFIRFYGDSLQAAFTSYFEKNLSLFEEQQARFQKHLHELMTSNPLDAMSELTSKNLEIWREIHAIFLAASGLSPQKPGTKSVTSAPNRAHEGGD